MKKSISLFLALIMILSMSTSALALEAESTGHISTSNAGSISQNDYSVAFEITYTWADCYAATISISNLSEKNIENWELVFDLGSAITKIENAQINEVASDKYFLAPKAYSRVIPANETVQIGVLIAGTAETIPSSFSLSGTYQNGITANVVIDENDLYQGDGEFYVINDSVTSLTATLVGIVSISNCVYVIEDEYGNVLSKGKVIADGKLAINDIGFGIGYNRVTIMGTSEGTPVYASFDVVNFNMENVKQLGIDVETDTDNDGICNYLENALDTDPYNANSIDKEKTDYESVLGVIGIGSIESENEAIEIEEIDEVEGENIPAELAATSITSMVIHRSKKPEGSKTDTSVYPKYVADDLTFNDYTYLELCGEGAVFAVANVTPEALMWAEMSAIFAAAKRPGASMNDVLDDLVDTFRYGNTANEGTTVEVGDSYSSSKYIKYSNSTLTSTVRADEATVTYTNLIKNFVVDYLRNGGDPYDLQYLIGGEDDVIEEYVYSFATTPYPSYGGATALGISIHGWHGHTITLQNYRETSTGFTGTLKFHFYDHFGLDQDDEITTVGFCDWFTLQHYTRFDGLYVPFLTYCDISISISGTFR